MRLLPLGNGTHHLPGPECWQFCNHRQTALVLYSLIPPPKPLPLGPCKQPAQGEGRQSGEKTDKTSHSPVPEGSSPTPDLGAERGRLISEGR